MHFKNKEFIYSNSWFDKKYATLSDYRYPTFKAALNLFLQRGGKTIVETGCVRQADDFSGAGASTILLSDFANRYDAHLWSVDLSTENLKIAEGLTVKFASSRTLIESDSIKFLENFGQPIDLFYADSFDYPDYEVAMKYSSVYADGWTIAKTMSDEQVLADNYDALLPCQTHCLNEIIAVMPRLDQNSIILIDDNLPGGGKGRLARDWLMENGWVCILDAYQGLFIRSAS